MARFNRAFSWVSAITSHGLRAANARSSSAAMGTLGPRNERSEVDSTNMSAEGTNYSGSSVSLRAFMAKLGSNFFFSLGRLIRSFRNIRLLGAWYFSYIPSALWYCVPDLCHLTSWILLMSTKVSLNYGPSSKIKFFAIQCKHLPV